MTASRQTRTVVAVLLALGLAAGANGCEIIANFDRSLIKGDAGSQDASYDASPFEDVAVPEASAGDTGPHVDSGPGPLDGGPDTSVQDSSSPDTSDGQTTATDSNAPDTSDTSTAPDTGVDSGEDASDDGG